MQPNILNKVKLLLYDILKYSFKKYFKFGSVSPLFIWREIIFVLGSIRFNWESMDSILLQYATSVKNMINHNKVICGCEIFISESIMKYILNARRSGKMKKLISVSERSHSRRSGQGTKNDGLH